MERIEKVILGSLLLVLVATFGFYFAFQPVGYTAYTGQNVQINDYLDPSVSHAPQVHVDNVEVQVYNAQGKWIGTYDNHNLLTQVGQNLIKCYVGQGQTANSTCAPALYLMVTNATFTASATHVSCDAAASAVENKYGLAPALGTYVSTGLGTWNVSYTFTLNTTPASAQVLYGACLTTSATIAATNNFAEALFGSTATLTASGDYCKVIYSLTAS